MDQRGVGQRAIGAGDVRPARRLAEGLVAIDGIDIDPEAIETNIVIFRVADPAGLCRRLAEEGILMAPLDGQTVRAVTHLDVDRSGIERALAGARRAAEAA